VPRTRNSENRGYPKSWRFRYDAYYYRVPKGQEHMWDGKKEFHLGRSLSEASTEWAKRLHRKYLDTRVDKNGEKSRATALYEIRVFRHAFSKGVEWGILDRHPFKGEVRLGAVAARDRYVEDWEIAQVLALKPKRDAGSVLMIQAYIRLKLLIGIRRGDMLRLQMKDLTDAGIVVRPHKTMHTRRTRRIFEWTPALEEAVSQAKAARPIDFSP
jgi:integrase